MFYPSGDANYTFTFQYDDDYNYEDNFTTIYLEMTDDNNSNCDYDEWFEDWNHVTEDTIQFDDTIVEFDPNTNVIVR